MCILFVIIFGALVHPAIDQTLQNSIQYINSYFDVVYFIIFFAHVCRSLFFSFFLFSLEYQRPCVCVCVIVLAEIRQWPYPITRTRLPNRNCFRCVQTPTVDTEHICIRESRSRLCSLWMQQRANTSEYRMHRIGCKSTTQWQLNTLLYFLSTVSILLSAQ